MSRHPAWASPIEVMPGRGFPGHIAISGQALGLRGRPSPEVPDGSRMSSKFQSGNAKTSRIMRISELDPASKTARPRP